MTFHGHSVTVVEFFMTSSTSIRRRVSRSSSDKTSEGMELAWKPRV